MSTVVALGKTRKKKRTLVEAHMPPANGAAVLPLRGLCPQDEKLTPYDFDNLATYACLIDGEEQGASLEELAQVVFGIDPVKHHDWAVRVALSHLRRAHWINTQIFPCFD